MTLPGFMMLRGSSACLMATIIATAPAQCSASRKRSESAAYQGQCRARRSPCRHRRSRARSTGHAVELPAPCGITGIRCSWLAATTAFTSAMELHCATASGATRSNSPAMPARSSHSAAAVPKRSANWFLIVSVKTAVSWPMIKSFFQNVRARRRYVETLLVYKSYSYDRIKHVPWHRYRHFSG